jgi:hypothetical protein
MGPPRNSTSASGSLSYYIVFLLSILELFLNRNGVL